MATVNKSKCPDCGARFKTVQMMTIHRRKAHGVLGQSQSSIAKRLLENPQPVANPAPNQCRFCGFQAKTKAGHTLHVNTYHAVKSEPLTGVAKRANSVERLKGSFQCSECDFVASWTGGLTLHMKKKHPERSVAIERTTKAEVTRVVRTNGKPKEEAHPVAGGYAIPDATLAVALGRFQGLCQSFAVEYDLPPRLFASRLAELIYHAQVR